MFEKKGHINDVKNDVPDSLKTGKIAPSKRVYKKVVC